MFGKKAKETDNPYLNARRTWNTHEGDILASRTLWQIVGVVSLLIALSAVGGVVYIGQQSKFIPYVVEVDKLGQSVAVARADQAAPVDARVMHATVAAWISDARLVTPDITVQRAAIFRVYPECTATFPDDHGKPGERKTEQAFACPECSGPLKHFKTKKGTMCFACFAEEAHKSNKTLFWDDDGGKPKFVR